MRSIHILLALLLISAAAHAQQPVSVEFYSAPTTAYVGETKAYVVQFRNASGNVVVAPNYGGASWIPSGGTVLNPTITTASIRWAATGTFRFDYSWDFEDDDGSDTDGDYSASLLTHVMVTVLPLPAVNTSFTFEYNCGNTVIHRTSDPPSGLEWVWTTSPDVVKPPFMLGTDASVTRTTSTPLYLRARVTGSSIYGPAFAVPPFTVYTVPPFTASNDGPKCATDPAPIVNLSATNIPGATYYWTGPYNAHQTTSVNTTSVNGLAGTFDYTVYATFNGCTTATATTSVTLYPAPPQTFAGANQDLCALTTTLDASPAGTGFTGHWDQVSGPTGAQTQFQNAGAYNTAVSVTTPGTYVYRWTVSGASVCTPSTAQVSVTFNITPSVYAVTASSASPRCANATPITISLAGSQTGINYQLKINGTNAGTPVAGTGNALTWSDQGSGTYSIQAIGTGGCAQVMTGTPVITVNPAPAIYTVGGGGAVCAGSSFAITLDRSDIGVNYVLTRGTTTISTLAGTGNALSWGNQVLPGTFTVTATNATSGCTLSMGSTTVTLNTLPSLYSVSGGGDRCDDQSGLTVSLNGSQAPQGTNIITYQLKRNNMDVGTPVTGTGNALNWAGLTDAGTYTIQAIHSNGCTRTMTNTVTINTKAAPTIANAGPDINACGQEITLSANTPTVGTGAWVQVSGPAQSHINNPLSPNTIVSVTQPNTYVYAWTITNSNGCTSTDNVQVIYNATATPASAGPDQTICDDLFATMSGNTPLVGNGEWVQVSGPDGAVFFPDSNTPDAYLFVPESGTYVYRWTITNQPCAPRTDDVQITFSTGCSARVALTNGDARKQQPATLSESSELSSEAVQIYPVPASESITVEIPFEGTWKAELRNMNGVLVKTLTSNEKTSTLEVSEIPTGLYVLYIQGSNKRFIKKVEVAR